MKFWSGTILWSAITLAFLPLSAQTIDSNITTVAYHDKYPNKLTKDVWGYVLEDGTEIGLLTYTNGLSIINVTDPQNIIEIDFIPAPETNWKTIKTYKHYAYLGTDNGGQGLQIIDLSGLPNSVKELPAYRGSGFTSTHNIWIDTTRALLYATGTNGRAFRIISLADPENPVQLYTHSAESHDFYTYENLMFMPMGWSDQMLIYDVTNPSSPNVAGIIQFPGGDTYVHSVRITDDGNYLLTTEEEAGKTLKVWDIRNLNDIKLVDEYLAGDDPSQSIAHNVYIKGDTAYVSHYGQGLRVLDISDPTNVVEISYFQPQYPSQNQTLLFGSFGAYVHFPSGNILSSDATNGLYIQQVGDVSSIKPTKNLFGLTQNGFKFSFNISSPQNYIMNIFDIIGKTIFTETGILTERKNEILIHSNLPIGMYVIKFNSKELNFIKTISLYSN